MPPAMADSESAVELAQPSAQSVRAALEQRDAARLRDWAEHEPAALADLLVDLLGRRAEAETAVAAELLGDELTAEVVAELDPGEAADILERLDPADVLEEMSPDDAADVVEEFDRADAEEVLGEMQAADAQELRELLAFPPDSAGGIMTPDFVAVRPSWTVEQAIAELRRVADEA